MNTKPRISGPLARRLLLSMLSLSLLVAVAGCGAAARAIGTSEEVAQSPKVSSSASCKDWPSDLSTVVPKSLVPKERPILAGPINVGCGARLGEPVRFVAYVQATPHGGEQLCYVLEQRGQKAATGGSCLETAPSFFQCKEHCPLIVEATVGKWGREASKGSLITGAAPGVVEEVALSTAPLGDKEVTRPFVVVLKGSLQEKLRLPSAVSLFASVVIPCLPAGQIVHVEGNVSGEEFVMLGSDPFGCRA